MEFKFLHVLDKNSIIEIHPQNKSLRFYNKTFKTMIKYVNKIYLLLIKRSYCCVFANFPKQKQKVQKDTGGESPVFRKLQHLKGK